MSHYYKNDKTLGHKEFQFECYIKDIHLILKSDLGVFSKTGLDYGTKVLLEHVDFDLEKKIIIDMGCGYGPIGLFLAKRYPLSKIYLYDVNERAVELARKNIEMNQLKNASSEVSNLFDQVKFKADVILTNPPIRAGKKVIFELYHQAHETLKTGGLFYVVIQKKQGAPSTVAEIHNLFGNITILDKNKGYWVLLAEK